MEKDKFREIKEEILKEIKDTETIIIHRHKRPDPDAIGSQIGLAELIKSTYPNKKIYTAGEDNRTLNFLSKMNPPAKEDYKNALVLILDTANRPRIDGDFALKEGLKVIKIDHHPDEDQYGDIQWVDPTVSSTSEMISDFWLSFPEELTLSDEGARHLYAGIIGDTNRFLYQSTSPKTMYLAGKLMEKEFSHTELNEKMNEMSPNTARLTAYLLENLTVSENGVGSIVLTKKLLEKFNMTDEDTHQVVSLPGSIAGVLNWGVFVEQKDGSFRCRLRSKGPVINDIAKEHHGGGHPLASGANAKDVEEIGEILAKFEEKAKAYKQKTK